MKYRVAEGCMAKANTLVGTRRNYKLQVCTLGCNAWHAGATCLVGMEAVFANPKT